MERFTIRDIENLCQIKAHTLRIWEQRYSFFAAKRKDSLHRYYDNDDLQVLLQVAYLYHGGKKISQIAAMTTADRVAAMDEIRQRGGLPEQEVLALVLAASQFDEHRFRSQLTRIVEQKGLEDAVIDVCFPFLQRIGHLWLTNHVIPAQEHFASYLVQHKIIAEIETLPDTAAKRPSILIMAPRGEHHELPLLFIHYLLRKYGWPVTYLGPNISVRDLPESVTERADIFYIHVLTNLTGLSGDDFFESVCLAYPSKTIVASGGAVHGLQRSFRNLLPLRSDEAIRRFIREGISAA